MSLAGLQQRFLERLGEGGARMFPFALEYSSWEKRHRSLHQAQGPLHDC